MPFRLTRDIEDALGVAGVEGVLRSSAEHTMRVLRAHSDALITILQVFVRNPLYKWSLDPLRSATTATKAGFEAGTNGEAERALVRIQDKLAGRVAGTSEALADDPGGR